MRNLFGIRSLLFSAVVLAMSAASFGQIGVSISLAPPALPVYEQPICPSDGYLWTPGYWAYGDDGYYWVSGDWIQPPEVGFLWTPGYWGWGGNAYAFHEGYWGQTVGFYGGISYGFGYTGHGYEGGRWDNGHFAYNTSVNRVNTEIIHNTYNTRVVESNTRVSFNGGTGGIEARATVQEEAAGRERHIVPVAAQTAHVAEARSNPELRASANHGNVPAAAVAKAETPGSREAANERVATPAKESEREKTSTVAAPSTDASEIAAHKTTAPNTGNAKTDQKYQKQQDTLVAKQNQDHQKLAQQQEKEHQQLTKSHASEAQKQQVEQKHQQQTTQLEQKHAGQTQVQTRQQPARGGASKPVESRPEATKPH
jgi:hypothetical protein